MKLFFLIVLILVSATAYSGDKGNGGSGTETQIAVQERKLELLSLELRMFFIEHEFVLASDFPELDIGALASKIKKSEIRVVDAKLIDKHGKSRTCLNFPKKSLIQCRSSELVPIMDDPAALYVLLFHEYLGLIGAEETSPSNPRMIDGYSISKRLAVYVTNDGTYDLRLDAQPTSADFRAYRKQGIVSVATISNKGWSLVPKKTKRIKVQMDAVGASLLSSSYELYFRESSNEDWKLLSKGEFQNVSIQQAVAYIAFEPGKQYSIKISGEAYRPESEFGIFSLEPHTERLRLLTDEDAVIFDSKEVPVAFEPLDPNAALKGSVFLDYSVSFK